MRIRLPIAPVGELAPAIEPRGPRLPAARAIGIAATSEGTDAHDFALHLAELLAAARVSSAVCLLAYGARPRLDDATRARAARAQVALGAHAIDPEGAADPAIDPGAALLILVGAPALGSFAPRFALLLGAERPLNQWPPFLRRERASFHLELAGDGRAVAQPLVTQLVARGFLPGR